LGGGEYEEPPAARTGIDSYALVHSARIYSLSPDTTERAEKMRACITNDEAVEGLARGYSGFRPCLALRRRNEHCKVIAK
jgi:hypothetical protein